ncbi:hypothetical protein ACFXKD_04615 [Nocardiopsis aegyptia]|uniref:hypothetical protein n=1 Tax=Nocardiopsis aegyptia TaxID=220378 RepID=UPI00366A69F8
MDVVATGAGVLAGASGPGAQSRPPPLDPVLQQAQEQVGGAQCESAGEQSDRQGQEEEQERGGAERGWRIPGRLRQR